MDTNSARPLATVSPEDFRLWAEHPVTRWVMQGAALFADQQKQAWTEASWSQGLCDPMNLNELRTRADAYAALFETEYEGWCEANGQDPQPEE